MLGLRKVMGCQIDLHQGEVGRFVCDRALPEYRDSASFRRSLEAGQEAGARHLVVSPAASPTPGMGADAVAKAAMEVVRDFVQSGRRGTVARITFILSSLSDYQIFQAALFQTFPEED